MSIVEFVSIVQKKKKKPVNPPDPIATEFVWPGAITTDGLIVSTRLEEEGSARLVVSQSPDLSDPVYSGWAMTNLDKHVKLSISELDSGTAYYFGVQIGSEIDFSNLGTFKTLPEGPSSFKLVTSSCAFTGSEHIVFELIKETHSDAVAFIHTGDIHYQNIASNDPQLFRNSLRSVFSSNRQQALYRSIPTIYMWDDHDFGPDNSGDNSPSKESSMQVYREYVPHYPLLSGTAGPMDAVGQTFSIGRVRFILLDARSHKIEGTTRLGSKQKQWLKDTLLSATEPVIGLMVGVPWISNSSGDTWYGNANERQELADFFVQNWLNERLFIWAGDMHGIAIDNGLNSQYASGGISTHASGPPVFQFAALDQAGSVKGGPYSEGSFAGGGQFGTFEITDEIDLISVKGTGYRVVDNELEEVISYTKNFML